VLEVESITMVQSIKSVDRRYVSNEHIVSIDTSITCMHSIVRKFRTNSFASMHTFVLLWEWQFCHSISMIKIESGIGSRIDSQDRFGSGIGSRIDSQDRFGRTETYSKET
jgi:hypothetical protein